MDPRQQALFDAIYARQYGLHEPSCGPATTSEIVVDEDPDMFVTNRDELEFVRSYVLFVFDFVQKLSKKTKIFQVDGKTDLFNISNMSTLVQKAPPEAVITYFLN